jgi:hypothetical protein
LGCCVIALNLNLFLCYFPDDGGSKHLWNVGKLLPDYMA